MIEKESEVEKEREGVRDKERERKVEKRERQVEKRERLGRREKGRWRRGRDGVGDGVGGREGEGEGHCCRLIYTPLIKKNCVNYENRNQRTLSDKRTLSPQNAGESRTTFPLEYAWLKQMRVRSHHV